MRILIVDDYVALARSLQRVLEGEHEVHVSLGGRDALALIDSDRARGVFFDCILCDVGMQGVSGADVWRALAQRGEEGRIVFMTGGATSVSARAFLAGVGNICLEKPFPPERLCQLLRDRA